MRTALVACCLSAAALAPAAALGQYFPQADLDYWNERRPERAAPEAEEAPSRPLDAGEFRWEDYEDPRREVFWDDGGNYVPPRPLRVAAADPTPANVARYLRWQRRKLEVIGALNREMDRQLAVDEAAAPSPAEAGRGTLTPQQAAAVREAADPIDWRRLDLVLFYRSDCPHCQASVETVRRLEALGARVIPVQVDWRERAPLLPGSVHYTAEIAREQPIEAVPTWVASYGGDRVTMQGEVTVQSIEVTLMMAQRKARPTTQHLAGG